MNAMLRHYHDTYTNLPIFYITIIPLQNFHGEHGMSDKWYAFEESIKVPLIIKDPRMPEQQQGTTNGEFTLSVDLAPTILSAANIQVPDVMQGRDIAPLYTKPVSTAANWRKDFFYEWTQGDHNAVGHNAYYHIPAVFALIQKEFKYVYWPQTKYEQLYNYAQDPFEEYDIFNSTAQTNQQLLLDMKARYAYLKNISQNGYPV
jgi:arylsulfatase